MKIIEAPKIKINWNNNVFKYKRQIAFPDLLGNITPKIQAAEPSGIYAGRRENVFEQPESLVRWISIKSPQFVLGARKHFVGKC